MKKVNGLFVPAIFLLLEDLVMLFLIRKNGGNIQAGIISFFLITFWGLVCSEVQSDFHEVGHLLGGFFTGYRLVFLRVGPVLIIPKHRTLLIFKNKKKENQCVMMPRVMNTRVPYILYNAGGFLLNMILSIISAYVFVIHFFNQKHLEIVSLAWSIFFLSMFFTGVLKVFLNIIPSSAEKKPNDFETILLLRKKVKIQHDYACYLCFFGALQLGIKTNSNSFRYNRKKENDRDSLLFYEALNDLLK